MKKLKSIEIRGARVHNLKNIDVDIPVGKITVIAGPSGSGKSSLAFHTLYAESKRRFLASYPKYLKFFGDRPSAADVDSIRPILPVFALPQNNPIVGARTNLADSLGLTERVQQLWYRAHTLVCPDHQIKLQEVHPEETIKLALSKLGKLDPRVTLHVFVSREDFIEHFPSGGLPSQVYNEDSSELGLYSDEAKYLLLFKLRYAQINRFVEKLKDLKPRGGLSHFWVYLKGEKQLIPILLKSGFHCSQCEYYVEERFSLESFSSYNALGACNACNGYGATLEYSRKKLFPDPTLSIKAGAAYLLRYSKFTHHLRVLIKEMKKNALDPEIPFSKLSQKKWKILFEGSGNFIGLNAMLRDLESKKYKQHVRIYLRSLQEEVECEECSGTRIQKYVSVSQLEHGHLNLKQFLKLSIHEALDKINDISSKYSEKHLKKLIQSTANILRAAESLGLGHLGLNRRSKSLGPGEYQRCQLVKFLAYDGRGSLFIFDEPTLGLDAKQQRKLMTEFSKLKKQGNTVVIVDHSEVIFELSDHFIRIGPGAGKLGGEIVFQGGFKEKKFKSKLKKSNQTPKKWIRCRGVSSLGLRPRDLKIPLDALTTVSGPSGSGKTAYFVHAIGNNLSRLLGQEELTEIDGKVASFGGHKSLSQVLLFDSRLGKSNARSNVGTATGLVQALRKYYAQLPIAKILQLEEGHFSPNSKLGQCLTCEGRGYKTIEMHFLEDINLICEDCKGMRLAPRYAGVTDGKLSVHEAYTLPIEQVFQHIPLTPKYRRIVEHLKRLSLDYLSVDRSLTSLSGGERQRLKLLSHLQTRPCNSLLIFENLSFGLSAQDLQNIGEFLQSLIGLGNTAIVIDPNPLFEKLSQYHIRL